MSALRGKSERGWVVIWGAGDLIGATDCVYVVAADEQAAAQAGLESLLAEATYDSVDDLRALSVVDASHLAVYTRENRAERAELQCCGGLGDDLRFGGHTAVCPELSGETDEARS